MVNGYVSVSLHINTYTKLKDFASRRNLSMSKAVEVLLECYEKYEMLDKLKEEIIEHIDRKLEEIAGKISTAKKKTMFEIIREAFLGLREPVTVKNITVSKAQILVKTNGLPINIDRFDARAFEEVDENGNVVGISIVPKVGFGESLEEWADRYLKDLLTEILKNR